MSISKAQIRTVVLSRDIHIRLEFSSERELRDAYSELELITKRVTEPEDLYNTQKMNRLQAIVNALASSLKSGEVWSDYHERLLRL